MNMSFSNHHEWSLRLDVASSIFHLWDVWPSGLICDKDSRDNAISSYLRKISAQAHKDMHSCASGRTLSYIPSLQFCYFSEFCPSLCSPHTCSISMASATLALDSTDHVRQTSAISLIGSDVVFPWPWAPAPPSPPLDNVDASWLTWLERACSKDIQEIFLHSRKPSTRDTYLTKWKPFSI